MIEKNIAYSQVKEQKKAYSILQSIKANAVLYYTLLSLLLKSMLFIGITASDTALNIDFNFIINSGLPIFVYLSFIAIFLSFAFLFKGRKQMWYLIMTNLFISVIFVIDIWYYRGFGSFTTIHLIKQTANLDNMGDSIISFIYFIDIIFIADIFVLFYLALSKKELYNNAGRSILSSMILFVLSVSYLGFVHLWYDVLDKGTDGRCFFTKEMAFNPKWSVSTLSPIGYHITDIYAYYKDSKPYSLTSDEKNEIKEWFHKKVENLSDNKYKGLFKGKNLILIQVESFEKFVINQKINGQEITPNINKYLKNSLYFKNFYEQVNNGNSSDGDLLANTSIYPVRTGSTFFRYPNNTYNSLPKILKSMGYTTLAIHPDKGGFWNWMPALYSIGFDKCIDAAHFAQDEIIGLGLSDGSYFKQVRPIVTKLREPFYTFMVTLTSHGPFDLPKEYRELTLDSNLDSTKLGGYFQSIHYTDKHIGSFIEGLEKDGLLDNTVIVIYGDHSGVHKYYNEELKDIKPSENWWLEGKYEIPFIIYNKDLEGKEIDVTGGQVDILPTIAYLMGIEEEAIKNTAMGRNLLKTNKDFAVLSSGKYIGKSLNKAEEDEAIKGLELADKIIRSNYFKDKY